ncbi:MAG: hypothetical protein H6773_02235 [Pseudomonadales bacterium]|nr:hypothetical protein [Pseudomonadales bacterium]
MSQVYQILSKESESSPLSEQLADQSAGQFLLSVVAQELRHLSEQLQESTIVSTSFETIKQLLRSIRATEISTRLQTIFSGKN